MSITRNNHYVPQWYQEGFFEPGRSSLAYLDLTPDRRVLADGRVIVQRGAWDETPTSMAFRQRDLYSTFFGTSVNDEIERHLSAISTIGALKPFAHSQAQMHGNGINISKRYSNFSIFKKFVHRKDWTG